MTEVPIVVRVTSQGIRITADELAKLRGEISGVGKQAKEDATWLNEFGSVLQTTFTAAAVTGVIRTGIHLTELGDTIRRTDSILRAYSANAQADMEAVVRGSRGMATEFEATGIAATLLKNRIATNTAEVEKFARVASTLGSTTGLTAGQYIQELNAAIANSSWDRIDQLGLVSANVREEVARLRAEGVLLQEAFRTAVLKDAELQVRLLEEAGYTSASGLNALTIAFNDFKDGVAVGMSEAVASASDTMGSYSEITGQAGVSTRDFGETLVDVALRLSGLQQGLDNSAASTQMFVDATRTAEAGAERSARINLIWADANARVADEMRNIPLTDTAGRSQLLAQAFLEAGRAAGFAQSEIILLWQASGGLQQELGIMGSKAYGTADALNAVGVAARNATRDVLMFKEAAADRAFSGINAPPRRDTRFGLQEALAYNNQFVQTGADEYFDPTPEHVISNANWRLNNLEWEQPWRDAAVAAGRGSQAMGDAAKEAEKAWQEALSEIDSAISSAMDMGIGVTRNQTLMAAAGIYEEQFNEAGRQLEDVINRGADSPFAVKYFEALIGDETQLKAAAAQMQEEIAQYLHPDKLNYDALLRKARQNLIGDRNKQELMERARNDLLSEGFADADIQKTLGEQLGVAFTGASQIATPELVDSIASTLSTGIRGKESEFRELGVFIGQQLREGIYNQMMEVAADVFEAIAASAEGA